MNARILAFLFVLGTAACGADFPRDPDGTLRQIRATRSFSVGIVAPLAHDRHTSDVQALLEQIGGAAGASPRIETGDTEALLKRLEAGQLDLVIGRFDKKSPWAKLVTIGPPLRIEHQGEAELHLAPAMQNGENAWIALVEREARDLAPEAQ